MAEADHSRASRLLRSSHKQPGSSSVPAHSGRSLATHASAAQPEGWLHLGAHGEAGERLAPQAADPSSLALGALRRQTPKVGAECPNRARSDLCGGTGATRFPTAIPLMTCRNVFNRRRNRDLHFVPRAKGWAMPADGPTGVRQEGGVTSRQASVRNTGTCRPDAKGETQAVNRREGPSTDAGHRGGGARSRGDGSVMGPDRRGVVIRLYPGGNPQGDDRHG